VPRRRELHDPFFRKAKAEGYAARSAYKLIEINERRRVLGPGLRVLDLGCAPGSWMQVAAEAVGPGGRVVGLDLQPVTIALPPNAKALVGDVFGAGSAALVAGALGVGGGGDPDDGATGPFDVVLSDMAPNTTGAGDHFRSVALCRRVVEILPALLRPGGDCVMKVFEGEEYPALLREVGALFASVRGLKPKATRDVSREMFVIAQGYQGGGGRRAGADAAGERADRAAPAKGKPPAPRAGWGEPGEGRGARP